MMRSMFSGISGLKGFQNSMDVIGNNIANVNTVGFKVSRTTFQSMLNQTVIGAKSPESGGRGGTNSMQIGLGSQLGSIGKIMTQGSFQNTGKKTDLGLQGDGFFVLSDGLQDFYSRAGNFELDENGNFVQPSTGLKLQGWLSKIDPKTGVRYLDLDKPPRDLFIQAGMTMPAKATSNASIGGNLNSKVGIEPLTITVKNPDDPTKNYKVRFSFEKLAPYDTKRLFSSSTIKYTWHAELVDWNAESPSELPELNYKTGLVELNQFGQIERFERYANSQINGNNTLLDGKIDGAAFTSDIFNTNGSVNYFDYSPEGNTEIEKKIRAIFDPDNDGILDKPLNGINLFFNTEAESAFVSSSNTLTAHTTANFGLTFNTANISIGTNEEIITEFYRQDTFGTAAITNSFTANGLVLDSTSDTDGVKDGVTNKDFLFEYYDTSITGYKTLDLSKYTYDTKTQEIKIEDSVLNTINTASAAASVKITYLTQETVNGTGTSSYTIAASAVLKPSELGNAVENDFIGTGNYTTRVLLNLDENTTDKRLEFSNEIPINFSASLSANVTKFILEYDSESNILFDSNIINGNAERTWFNYAPIGDNENEEKIRELFDSNEDGIMDKIITNVKYHLQDGEFSFSSTPNSTAATVDFTLSSIKPASGDLASVTYYTQEDNSYVEGKNKYSIAGPILDSGGNERISTDDIVVKIIDTNDNETTLIASDGDFSYDATSGTVNILRTSLLDSAKTIRFEYCTKDTFSGDGSTSSWALSKKIISMPDELDGKATKGKDYLANIDLQYNINAENRRVEFRTNYPYEDQKAENYEIFYADPNNPQEFDTVGIMVGGETKAQVSIPKTGNIKFFDKNDTQNYVIGDYESPSYTTSTRLYDSLGNNYTVFFNFQKITDNQWAWQATEESGIPVSFVDDQEKTYTPNPNDLNSIVGGVVEFDSGGRISSLKAIRQNGKIEDDISITRIKFDPGNLIDDGAAPPPEEGATPVSASVDFSELVQFNSEFSASVTKQDGNSMGVLQNYAINPAGEVVGTFSNGKSDILGQLAIALFNNPAGLTEMGNTLFQISANSGEAQVGLPGSGGRATVSPGVLEMSNVDLAEEFTGMVIVQRAFQANARTVTTVDQILQELVNLKR